jgi:hypothetical protein
MQYMGYEIMDLNDLTLDQLFVALVCAYLLTVFLSDNLWKELYLIHGTCIRHGDLANIEWFGSSFLLGTCTIVKARRIVTSAQIPALGQ